MNAELELELARLVPKMGQLPGALVPELAASLGCNLITFTSSVAGKIHSPHTAIQLFDATSSNDLKVTLGLNVSTPFLVNTKLDRCAGSSIKSPAR
jgi:hypothetical protein